MSLDKALKTYKQGLKASDATLGELEDRARGFAAMEDSRRVAEQEFRTAQAELESVAASKEITKDELDEAVRFADPRADGLRDGYAELSDREQVLRDAMGDATKTIEQNTPNAGEIAELTTRLKQFRGPSAGDVVKAIQTHAQEHAQGTQERVQVALGKLPTIDPRSTHRALMALDEGYRKNEGASYEGFLRDEDEKGNSEAATATLASKLEARERRAVIRARK